MARSAVPFTSGAARPERAPLAFDVAVLGAAMWFFGGLLLDGWAHNHLDLSREGFFTPYHAVFYSGYAALAAVLGVAAWRHRVPGRPWYRSFPEAYGSMAAGIAIFAVGGILDMTWHLAFGIEQDVEALFSPTHLLLAVGGATMLCGPIRAGLGRPDARTWRQRFPELVALALFGTQISFFFMWAATTDASVASDPHRLYPALTGQSLADVRDLQIQNGITTVILTSLVIAGISGFAARRLALPFGAVTLLVAAPTVLIAVMLDPAVVPVSLKLVAALAAGIAGDVALARWGRLQTPTWRSRAFAFGVPFVFWAVYFALAAVLVGGFWWSPHIVYGAPVIGGLIGLLLTLGGESRADLSNTESRTSSAA